MKDDPVKRFRLLLIPQMPYLNGFFLFQRELKIITNSREDISSRLVTVVETSHLRVRGKYVVRNSLLLVGGSKLV